MSLTSCLREAGDALTRENRAEVLRLSRKYRTEGMAADPAALRAIDEVIAAREKDLQARIQSVAAPAPTPAPAQDKNGEPMTEPKVLYRAVSPREWAAIQKAGAIEGGLNRFNPFDQRREVFFGDALNPALIYQGEDVTRQAEYAVGQTGGALQLEYEQANKDLKEAIDKRDAAVKAAGFTRPDELVPLQRRRLLGALDKQIQALETLQAELEKRGREAIAAEVKNLRAEQAAGGITAVVLQTKAIGGGRVYTGKHSGMGDQPEYGFPSGAVKLADVERIHFVKDGKVLREEPGPAAAKAAKPRKPRVAPSADTLRAQADLNNALADLGDLLGKGTRLNIVPEQEAKLLPILTRVLDAAFRLGFHKFKDAAKFALDTIRDKLGAEVADALTLDHLQGAYIAMAGGKPEADSKRAVIDVESKDEIERHTLDEETDDVPSTPASSQRDSGQPAAVAPVGAGVPGADAGRAGAGDGQGADAGARRAGGAGVPDGGPVAGGERGNQRVDGRGGPRRPADRLAGADLESGSSGPSDTGAPADVDAGASPDAGAQRDDDEATRRRKQSAVDERVRRGELTIRLADRASIEETLPYLLPAQREDVYKAELQHAKPDGYGMLFTNGTGTGKTFSGLGVIKRRQLLGQLDQFIAVPDNKIAADWIEAAKALNLTVTQLPDTKTAGEGIVITTYANLGENDQLASRKWKHVLADEAHSLMQSADGELTGYLENLRAISYHPQGQHAAWMMRHRELHNELADLTEKITANNKIMSNADTMDAMVTALRSENQKLQQRADAISRNLGEKREAIRREWEANQKEARTRATFLSATPYAYHTSLEWSQGYLFDYEENYPYKGMALGYNQPNPRQHFYITHLGYRMRYNKLTKPDASKVDVGMLERQLNSWMKKKGSLSGRMLEVAPDYDRRFVLIDSNIGNKIDEAIEFLREKSRQQAEASREAQKANPDAPREYGWGALEGAINDSFDYLSRRYLLEAIKAKESIPLVKEHLAKGRRVVVFHDYKKGSGNNPFDIEESALPKRDRYKGEKADEEFAEDTRRAEGFNRARAEFRAAFPELFTELVSLKPPIDAYREAFTEGKDLHVINGDEKPKDLLARYKAFQSDDGGPMVVLVQSDKNKGWSGHDTTGKHQRVLVNLGLPTAPTKLIQLEGRIYRTGVVTDAIMRSLNTGTNWERWAFAHTIASRASTAENLGMGELSRALRDSIIASFEAADKFPPGHDGEGKGGKQMDRAANNVLTDFDRAKTFYWATGKKTSRNKSEEGKDYYATPEPLGLKMVEWADARGGEDILEPSAGHGAIARWFPDLANRTAIEPSPLLMSRLGMAMNPAKDRLIDGTFEDHDIVNKYDAIVMNPPFGVGGKQAIEHVAKAVRHLRDGGRIVALIPGGPAADKRLEQFLYGKEERPAKPAFKSPAGDVYPGDVLELSLIGGGTFKMADPVVFVSMGAQYVVPRGAPKTNGINLNSAIRVIPGKRTEEYAPAAGLQLVADIHLPTSTFERAGTAVASHIIVLEKTSQNVGAPQRIELTNAANITELFDRIEDLSIRPRMKPQADEAAPADRVAPAAAAVPQVERGDEDLIEHTTQKGKVIRGIVRMGLTRADAQKIDPYTFPKNGGFFIREKYLKSGGDAAVGESTPEPYEVDLFGNALPQRQLTAPKPKRQTQRRPTMTQPALDLEGGDVNAEPREPERDMAPQLYVDSVLFKVMDRKVGASVIRDPGEAAAATRYLARSAVERLDLLVADKEGNILGVVGNFKGDRTITGGPPFTVLAEVLQIPRAEQVWVSHNHPSGTATLSDADRHLSRTYERMFRAAGIRVRGILAVTQRGDMFSAFLPSSGSEIEPQPIPAAKSPETTVPVYERELKDDRLLPRKISNTEEAKQLAVEFYRRSRGPGIILLDAQYALAGWVPLGPDMAQSLKAGGAVRRVFDAATRANTVASVVVHGGEFDNKVDGTDFTPTALTNILNAITIADIRVLDAVNAKTRQSNAERGLSLGGGGDLYAIDTGSIWSSPLAESISKSAMKQGAPQGWLEAIAGMVKAGKIKEAEVEWSGVREWLQLQGEGKVAKEALLSYLSDNGVKVTETLKGKSTSGAARELDDLVVQADALGYTFDRSAFDDGDGDYAGRPVQFRRRSDGSYWSASRNGLQQFEEYGEELDDDRVAYSPSPDIEAIARRMRELADAEVGNDDAGAEDTRYDDYTLPGGENYRELLLTLPVKPKLPNGFELKQQPGGLWVVNGPGPLPANRYASGTTADDAMASFVRQHGGGYKSSHWEERNIVAHIRMKERRLPGVDMNEIERRIVAAVGVKDPKSLGNGAPRHALAKKAITADEAAWYSHHRGFLNVDAKPAPQQRVLFIEEIQSDWAQAGRKKGFARLGELWTAADDDALVAANHALRDEIRAQDLLGFDTVGRAVAELRRAPKNFDVRESTLQALAKVDELAARRERTKDAVPHGPFVHSTEAWVTLALKRVVKFAVDNDFDKVAFVTGRQTAQRYSMRQAVDTIDWFVNTSGTRNVTLTLRRKGPMDLIVDGNGVVRGGGNTAGADAGFGGRPLAEVIGSELTDKIMAKESGSLAGGDLEIGGEGHIAFYDKIVPTVLGKLLPKLGGDKNLATLEIPAHRESISGGQKYTYGTLHDIQKPEGQRDYVIKAGGGLNDEPEIVAGPFPNGDAASAWLRANDPATRNVVSVKGFDVTPAMREAAAGPLPLFKAGERMTDAQVREQLAAARGMPTAKANAIVQALTAGWKGGIEVKVVATAKDLPIANPHPDTKGLYQNGVGYVVAAKHKTAQEVGMTLAHEVLAHHGMRNTLGEDGWRRYMAQIQAAANAGNPAIAEAREYVRRAYRNKDGSYMLEEGGTIEADEVAARLIEQSVQADGTMAPKLQFLKWVWAKIADFLRRVGLNIPLTMAELHGVYVASRRDIESGRGVLAEQMTALAAYREARGFNTRQIQVGGKWRPIDNSEGQLLAGHNPTAQAAFWKWFGDSKVVDAEGRPLVVYHGTRGDITTFGAGRTKFYFAESSDYAASFAGTNEYGDDKAPSLMPAYLSMRKPLDLTSLGAGLVPSARIIDALNAIGASRVAQAVEARNFEYYGRKQGVAVWELWHESTIREAVKDDGFDGIIQMEQAAKNERDMHEGRAFVVFRPEQIKSATGNRGTFDATNPDIRYAIDMVGNSGRPYTAAQVEAMKNVGFAADPVPLKDKLRSLWKDAGKRLAQGIVDQFAPIKDISKEAYGLLRLSKGASGAFEVLLHGGQLKLVEGVYDFDAAKRGGAVERLLIPLQGEHHDFLRWVAANRAEQLTKEDRERLFTPQDIEALKSLADGDLAFDFKLQHGPRAGKTTRRRAEAYADSLKTFNEFNKNTLDMAEQSGLIDAEGRALWEKEFYVPFYRVEDEGGVRGMNIKSGVVRQQAFKHLKGGRQKLNIDLLENTLMNWAHLIDAAAKNRAAKATLEAMGNLGAAVEAREDDVRQMGRSMSKSNNVVWFMDSGRKRWFLVDDPYLLAAVSALEFSGFNSPIMKLLGGAKHWLTVGVTASPFFKARNLIRDTVQAIGTAPLGANPLANVAQGWSATKLGSDQWLRLLASGGTIHFGTMMEGSEAKRVQALVESGVDRATILDSGAKVKHFYRHVVEPLITAYNELGNRGEAVNRAALYEQLRRQGVGHAEAALQARDLMDFSMQGSFTTVRFLTQVVPFMNARMQGLYKLGRGAAEDPARFAMVLAATAALSIGLLAAYGDDDDWKQREEWDRNNYWWFKAGGVAYRIPKPFEIGAFATLAERTWELAFEEEMTATRFREQVVALLGDQLALNPVPQLVKPIIDLYANNDSFTNRPIESMGMERLQPQLRYRSTTSMAARGASTVLSAAGRAIGVEGPSPVQIDHLVRAYFGWLGTLAVGAGDIIARPATDQPAQPEPDWLKFLTGSFVANLEDAPSRYVSAVYEQAKALEQVYGTWRHLLREGRIEEAQAFREEYAQELVRYRQVEAVKRAMTNLNQMRRKVEEGEGTPEEKRQRIRELNDRADLIARRLAPTS